MTNKNVDEGKFNDLRQLMVSQIENHTASVLENSGITSCSQGVLSALAKVPRHKFLPINLEAYAYADTALPIGNGKTISQPFIVALMTELLKIKKNAQILEIGTGSGYQTAILAELAKNVYTVEIIKNLSENARAILLDQGYRNIYFRIGDGNWGWPDFAPFDCIIATAASELIPAELIKQLKPNGRMVIPTGMIDKQNLLLVTKDSGNKIATKNIIPVRFSSMTPIRNH